MSNSNPLLWPRPPVIARYGIAVLSVVIALILGKWPALHLQDAPVSLFLCAVMFSAWFGGIRPGLLAISLSILAFYYFYLPPIHSLIPKTEEFPSLIIFSLSALFVGSLSAAQRRAAESLRSARDELEVTSQELEKINEALRAENAERKRTEDALRRSEAYLAEAQRLSLTGSFRWNVSSGETFWSEESYRIFQYDRTMKPTRELVLRRVHPEDVALVKQTIERAAQDGKDIDVENRLLMPDGSVKYIHVVAHALSDESGSPEFIGALMDLTEQYQARAALEKALDEIKKSQEQLQLVIDTIPAMTWSALPDGTTDFLSTSWVEYYGLTLEDISRQGLEIAIHPDDVERIHDIGIAAMAEEKPFEFEVRSRRADGQYRWFLHSAVPLRDEMGNIVKYYGTNLDIEERKLAEMLLAGEKRVLEMIARGEARTLILDGLCRLVEEVASGSLASILLLEPNANRLRHGAAPSLPITYTEAIDGSVIGPSAGSCGTAAYRAETVIVSDIATDPLWADYRDLALAHGLRACWSTPILSSDGRVLGTFAIYYREPRTPTSQEHNLIEQITDLASIAVERAQAEDVLREQARLLDLTHDTVFVRDMNDVITYWNRGAEELYGFTREEALGKVTHQLLQTSFPAPLDEINEQLLRTGRWEGELVHTRADGTRPVVASRWALQSDPQGNPLAILETNNDITESKQAAQALRRQANLLEQAHDAIFVWEFPGTIVYWNRGAEHLYGFSREEAIGRTSHDLLHTEHTMATSEFEAALEQDGEWTGELTQTTRDGRKIIVESRHVLIPEADGRRFVLETNRDITERKRAEEALRNAQAELAHVTRVTTLGEMAASIAHEIKQPLAAVVTNGSACLRWLARASPDLDEAREAVRRIIRDGNRANEVINRIRSLMQKTDSEKSRLDLNEVIQEVILLTQSEAARKGVTLRTELAAGLPMVFGDRVQLQQVLLNLLMNGVEAMASVSDRPREVVVSSRPYESDKILISTQDSGIGIERETLEKIFDAFYTTKSQGMGMGLAISRSIVENHGGRLWATPNDGPGATFHFTILQYRSTAGPTTG